MPVTPDFTAYRAWLQQRERSAGTIEKYLRDAARFFRETGAPDAPPKEAVAAWRDDLARRGYCAASVNAMLAAVNAYQDFCGNPAGKAKPLKCQRRIFCEARRELSRAEYFRLLDAARRTGRKRTLLVLQTLCATGIRVSELRFITAEAVRKGRAAIRCKGKCREILLPKPLCHKLERWCAKRRIHNGPVFLGRGGVRSAAGGAQTPRRPVTRFCEPYGKYPIHAARPPWMTRAALLFRGGFLWMRGGVCRLVCVAGRRERVYFPQTPRGAYSCREAYMPPLRMRGSRTRTKNVTTGQTPTGRMHAAPTMRRKQQKNRKRTAPQGWRRGQDPALQSGANGQQTRNPAWGIPLPGGMYAAPTHGPNAATTKKRQCKANGHGPPTCGPPNVAGAGVYGAARG